MPNQYLRFSGGVSCRAVDYLNIVQVQDMIEISRSVDPNCSWFLFGSLARGHETPSDVDLLVIANEVESCIRIRSDLTDLLSLNPVDLTILTWNEEAELSFVKTVSALAL